MVWINLKEIQDNIKKKKASSKKLLQPSPKSKAMDYNKRIENNVHTNSR